MSLKHISFHQSEVMRSLERQAVKAGHFEPSPEDIVKSAAVSISKKESYVPSDDLYNDLMKLASGLKERGYIDQAADIEQNAVLFKTAEIHLYRVHDEDGDDIINFAHPNGDAHVMDAQNELGNVETLIGTHLKFLEVVKKQPTGQNSISHAANIIKNEEPGFAALADFVKKKGFEKTAAGEGIVSALSGLGVGAAVAKLIPYLRSVAPQTIELATEIGGTAAGTEAAGAAGVAALGPWIAAALATGVVAWGVYSLVSKSPQGVAQWSDDVLDKLSELEDYERNFPTLITNIKKLSDVAKTYASMGRNPEDIINPNSPIVQAFANYNAQLEFVKKEIPTYLASVKTLGKDDFPVFGMNEVNDVIKSLTALNNEIDVAKGEIATFSKEYSAEVAKYQAQTGAAKQQAVLDSSIKMLQDAADYWSAFTQSAEANNKTIGLNNYNKISAFKKILEDNNNKPFGNVQAALKNAFKKEFGSVEELNNFVATWTGKKTASRKSQIQKLAQSPDPLALDTPNNQVTIPETTIKAAPPDPLSLEAPSKTQTPTSARPTPQEKAAIAKMQEMMFDIASIMNKSPAKISEMMLNPQDEQTKTIFTQENILKYAKAIGDTGTPGGEQFDGDWGPKVKEALTYVNLFTYRLGIAEVKAGEGNFRKSSVNEIIADAQYNTGILAQLAQKFNIQIQTPTKPEKLVALDYVDPGLKDTKSKFDQTTGIRVGEEDVGSLSDFINFLEYDVFGRRVLQEAKTASNHKTLAKIIVAQAQGLTNDDIRNSLIFFRQRAEVSNNPKYLALVNNLIREFKNPAAFQQAKYQATMKAQTVQYQPEQMQAQQPIADDTLAKSEPPLTDSSGRPKEYINIIDLLNEYNNGEGTDFYKKNIQNPLFAQRNLLDGNYTNLWHIYANTLAREVIDGKNLEKNLPYLNLMPISQAYVRNNNKALPPGIWFSEIIRQLAVDMGIVLSQWQYKLSNLPVKDPREASQRTSLIRANLTQAQLWTDAINTIINNSQYAMSKGR